MSEQLLRQGLENALAQQDLVISIPTGQPLTVQLHFARLRIKQLEERLVVSQKAFQHAFNGVAALMKTQRREFMRHTWMIEGGSHATDVAQQFPSLGSRSVDQGAE